VERCPKVEVCVLLSGETEGGEARPAILPVALQAYTGISGYLLLAVWILRKATQLCLSSTYFKNFSKAELAFVGN